MTTLSVDSTCIDTLMENHVPMKTRDFQIALLRSLFEQGLQITWYTCGMAAHRRDAGLAVLAEIRYESFVSPLLGDSELLEAIFMKSDHQLQAFLHQPRYLRALDADTFVNALIVSTVTGWTGGCRALFNANLMAYLDTPSSDTRDRGQSLLVISANTNRLDMLQFWLSQRKTCDEQQLNLIGHLEDALYLNGGTKSAVPTVDIIQLVFSHILEQRHEIKLLMEKHDIQHCCESARTRLPDAHVGCILTALLSEGVKVPQRYWPKRKSLYYMPQTWRSDRLKLLEFLELAGICDISQEGFKCNKETACSPLVYLATQFMRSTRPMCLTKRNLTVRWFLSRGANLRETWPESNTTAVHCLAWQSAEFLQSQVSPAYSDDPSILKDAWTYEDYEFLSKEEIFDECECRCSRAGCNFLTCFWKHVFAQDRWCPQFPLLCDRFKNVISARDLGNIMLCAPDGDNVELRYVLLTRTLLDLTLWVEKAAKTLELSRLIHGYIRLFVFSYLEIRHTCCDINRICHWDGPDYTKQPYPRYSPTELRRITNEDAHLRARLEQLVPELITRHNSFSGDLQDFVIDVLIPTMRRTAKELKEEDKTLYAAGRRELGVVMDEDEDDTEGESSEVDEEETDVEEESDDEY